ncbi:hypothetical protein MPC4_60179 [Methylocella tundrae]|uniref:Uncharacterized protein n=1 Tax=Methylocella tundrae TaxID=227605 RepID=A0A8B6MCQ4_METTU|nr:hypothetical protein MPC1_360011 [Methylocella tundrae]VTZ52089.1 hypothetical protein MPC4_60179 [Methylocella tundrae]
MFSHGFSVATADAAAGARALFVGFSLNNVTSANRRNGRIDVSLPSRGQGPSQLRKG